MALCGLYGVCREGAEHVTRLEPTGVLLYHIQMLFIPYSSPLPMLTY